MWPAGWQKFGCEQFVDTPAIVKVFKVIAGGRGTGKMG